MLLDLDLGLNLRKDENLMLYNIQLNVCSQTTLVSYTVGYSGSLLVSFHKFTQFIINNTKHVLAYLYHV